MKKTKRIITIMSTMLLAICLMVLGVQAATNQNLTTDGIINVNINDVTGHAKIAVTAEFKVGDSDFAQYGHKNAYQNAATFSVPTATLDETNYFLMHRFTFQNYGGAITNFAMLLNSTAEFDLNFNCYIYEEGEVKVISKEYQNSGTFLEEYGETVPVKVIYLLIELKDELTNPIFEEYYQINIEYQL